jgi:hypothetical protein
VDKNATIDNYRNKTPEQKFTPIQYIIVSTDQTFVSTSKTVRESRSELGSKTSKAAAKGAEEGGLEGEGGLEEEGGLEGLEELEEGEIEVKVPKLSRIEEGVETSASASSVKGSKPKIAFKDVSARVSGSTSAASTSASAAALEEAKFKFLGRKIPEVKSRAESGSRTEVKPESGSETSPRVNPLLKASKAEPKEAKAEKESKSSKSESKELKSEAKPESKAEA